MIERIYIKKYRKLNEVSFNFQPGLNAISGSNGTCKSSLLHIISNSFQKVTRKCEWIKDKGALSIIGEINSSLNPKIETLTRGDKQYNNPAEGIQGKLYSVKYFDGTSLDFRRHNSKNNPNDNNAENSRYAIKPMYRKGSGEMLPFCPVVYLGLSRLVPYGEFHNDESISKIAKNLPDEFQKELSELYREFTHISIDLIGVQKMGDVKTRTEFYSDKKGIDSNTISAGEDNLYILLTALQSLKYYYHSIESRNKIESILLIDELDATLHPAFQIKLLKLMEDYSLKYKIQIFFTTHSLSTLEEMLKNQNNVIYLIDNITDVALMNNPDIYKIKMHLKDETSKEIYMDKIIPIFSEDAEARIMIEGLFDVMEKNYPDFIKVRRFFYIVNVNLGSENLKNIFQDSKLLRTTIKSICILDGDHNSELSNCILALPGRNSIKESRGYSPEKLLLEYASSLYDSDDKFWKEELIINKGYGKRFYLDRIKSPVEVYENTIKKIEKIKKEIINASELEKPKLNDELENLKKQITKKPREFYKHIFNEELDFFRLLLKNWINNSENETSIKTFYDNLKKLFKKVAPYNEINIKEWEDENA